MRAIFFFVFLLATLLLFPLALAGAFLVLQSDANHSRLFGFAVMASFVAAYNLMRFFKDADGYPGRWSIIWVVITGGLTAGSYLLSPSGTTLVEGGAFQSIHDDGSTYPRWHPANLVAERDQLRCALSIYRWTGRDYDDDRGASAKRTVKAAYDDLEYHSEELIDYGSQLYRVYDAKLGRPNIGAHRYVYRSGKGREKAKMPVILFLHGGEGNLKAKSWAISDLADEIGMAVVAPTFSGSWEDPDAESFLRENLTFCASLPDLNADAIVLVGMGSGGLGVNLAARTMPDKFKGFVHISSEFTPESTIGLSAVEALKRTPMLILHGADDRLVRVQEVEKAIGDLKRWNMPITYQRFEQDGAILLFQRSDDVCNRIAQWMRSWRG